MQHFVKHNEINPPFPDGYQQVLFGCGCYWGVERIFWQIPGVHTTAVGFAGGMIKNPSYREVCAGTTNHAEVVLVVYDPKQIDFSSLLKTFWECHDPTQGDRQGNDRGTQYRSAIYTYSDEQLNAAIASKAAYQSALNAAGNATITTEITAAGEFYYAHEEHQQYLAKNPHGYCGIGGTGVSCPVLS